MAEVPKSSYIWEYSPNNTPLFRIEILDFDALDQDEQGAKAIKELYTLILKSLTPPQREEFIGHFSPRGQQALEILESSIYGTLDTKKVEAAAVVNVQMEQMKSMMEGMFKMMGNLSTNSSAPPDLSTIFGEIGKLAAGATEKKA